MKVFTFHRQYINTKHTHNNYSSSTYTLDTQPFIITQYFHAPKTRTLISTF